MKLNNFARRSFRDTADGDYIMARIGIRIKLVPQAIWASQQAIEKYLKAILLFNRIPCIKPRHNLIPLLAQAESIPDLQFRLLDGSREFVQYLDTYNPIRYLEDSYYGFGRMLFDLDTAVWEIRRFCEPRPRPGIAEAGSKPSQPSSSHNFDIWLGELEKILADTNHPARAALTWKNFHSGLRKRNTVRYSDWLISVNAPLALDPELFELLKPYVYLSKAVNKHFTELLSSRSSGSQ